MEIEVTPEQKAESLKGAKEALMRYQENRTPPGNTLRSLLANDLMGFVGSADPWHMANARELVAFVNCQMIIGCRGSHEKVREWLKGR